MITMTETPTEAANFKIFSEGGNIILQANDGKFVSRNTWSSGQNKLQANKDGIDLSCKFKVETGSLTPVHESITDLTWGQLDPTDFRTKRMVLDERIVDNINSSIPVEKTFAFSKTITR